MSLQEKIATTLAKDGWYCGECCYEVRQAECDRDGQCGYPACPTCKKLCDHAAQAVIDALGLVEDLSGLVLWQGKFTNLRRYVTAWEAM